MGVFTYETQIVTKIPPAKIFKAFVLDGDQILPKVVPQAIKSVEIIEGDEGPGTIKKITFGEGSQFSCVKLKVEALDKDNLIYRYAIIEGAALMDKLEKITYETKIEPSLEGGSICKNTSMYYTICDFEINSRLAKKRPLDCSMLLKLTSWQTLMPCEKFDHKTTIPFSDHMIV